MLLLKRCEDPALEANKSYHATGVWWNA